MPAFLLMCSLIFHVSRLPISMFYTFTFTFLSFSSAYKKNRFCFMWRHLECTIRFRVWFAKFCILSISFATTTIASRAVERSSYRNLLSALAYLSIRSFSRLACLRCRLTMTYGIICCYDVFVDTFSVSITTKKLQR